jgi:hypothetical protein
MWRITTKLRTKVNQPYIPRQSYISFAPWTPSVEEALKRNLTRPGWSMSYAPSFFRLLSPTRATCTAHLVLLDFITRVTSGEDSKSWISSNYDKKTLLPFAWQLCVTASSIHKAEKERTRVRTMYTRCDFSSPPLLLPVVLSRLLHTDTSPILFYASVVRISQANFKTSDRALRGQSHTFGRSRFQSLGDLMIRLCSSLRQWIPISPLPLKVGVIERLSRPKPWSQPQRTLTVSDDRITCEVTQTGAAGWCKYRHPFTGQLNKLPLWHLWRWESKERTHDYWCLHLQQGMSDTKKKKYR